MFLEKKSAKLDDWTRFMRFLVRTGNPNWFELVLRSVLS